MRGGQYKGWLPTLFVGELLQNKTVGIIGAGRIGSAYARMMVEARAPERGSRDEGRALGPFLTLTAAPARPSTACAQGHKMDLVYYDIYQNKQLEGYVAAYGDFLRSRGERPVTVTRCSSVEEVLRTADVVSLHTVRAQAA